MLLTFGLRMKTSELAARIRPRFVRGGSLAGSRRFAGVALARFGRLEKLLIKLFHFLRRSG